MGQQEAEEQNANMHMIIKDTKRNLTTIKHILQHSNSLHGKNPNCFVSRNKPTVFPSSSQTFTLLYTAETAAWMMLAEG